MPQPASMAHFGKQQHVNKLEKCTTTHCVMEYSPFMPQPASLAHLGK